MRPLPEIIEGLEKSEVRADRASTQMDGVANGPVGEFVETDNGPVPTIAQWYSQNEKFIEGVYIVGEQVAQDKIDTEQIKEDAVRETEQIKVDAITQTEQVREDAVVQINEIKDQAVLETTEQAERAEAAAVDFQENGVKKPDLASNEGASLVGFKLPHLLTYPTQIDQRFRAIPEDFSAAGDGIRDDRDSLNAFWQYVRESLVSFDSSTLGFVDRELKLLPGKYRMTGPADWSGLKGWNIPISANGAIIIGDFSEDYSIIELLNNRGVDISGLAVVSKQGSIQNSAILYGPGVLPDTSGNNRFTGVKTYGNFKIAAGHNIGGETTVHDYVYWQNKNNAGYAYAGERNNLLGARSAYRALRPAGTPVSFTSNSFNGCRFANYAANGNSTYLEGPAGWAFDKTCYFLSFDNAAVTIRHYDGRTKSLKLSGLFETSQGAGLKDIVRIIAAEGTFAAIDGFELDCASPHSSRSVIRLETPTGAELTSGEFQLRYATIKVDEKYIPTAPLTLFSGARLSFLGDLKIRPSEIIDLSRLIRMHGTIMTEDAALVIDTATGNHGYTVHDTRTLSGQGVSTGGVFGGFVGLQGGVNPAVRALSTNENADMWIRPKGTGKPRFGVWVNDGAGGYIEIKDDGGAIRRIRTISTT